MLPAIDRRPGSKPMRLQAGDKRYLLMPIEWREGPRVVVTFLRIGVDRQGQPVTASHGRSGSVAVGT
jgi:hypothetical protein